MPLLAGIDLPQTISYVVLGGFSLGVCVWAVPIGRALGVLDSPDGQRKIHKQETPLVGGIAILVPVVIGSAISALATVYSPLYGALSAAIFAFLLLGFLDDRTHIHPALRLAASVVLVVGILLVVPGYLVTFLKFSFLPAPIFLDGWVAVGFTTLCLVGLQNAVNMADGKDGLVMGMSLIWVVLLMGYAPPHVLPLLALFAVGLGISLAFNLQGKLFLGDSGSYGLSIGIGLLTIYSYNVDFPYFTAGKAALLFFIPSIDVVRLMVSRSLNGKSPFRSDRNHLHHILLGMLPWRWALIAYLALVGVPSLLALLVPSLTYVWALACLAAYGIILGLKYRASVKWPVASH